MNKIFTISALLGLAALAAGGGLLAGFSGGSYDARASVPATVSHSPRPSSEPEIVLPAPACSGAVPSALRVARFETAQVSSEPGLESAQTSQPREVASVAEASSNTVAISEPIETNSSSDVAVSSDTISTTNSSFAKQPAPRNVRRLPTLTGTVNPSAPGNSFSHKGQRVSVADVSQSANGEVAGIDLQSAPEAAPAAKNQQQASNKKPSAGTKKSSKSPYKLGLTYEEELFRTKWGWDAFAQAQSLGNSQ